MELAGLSPSAGGEGDETASFKFTGKGRRQRYLPLISPDVGMRVHYDRTLPNQHL